MYRYRNRLLLRFVPPSRCYPRVPACCCFVELMYTTYFKLLSHTPYCSLSPSAGASAAGLPAASRLAAMLRHVLPGTASLCTTPAACAAAVRARPISASGE